MSDITTETEFDKWLARVDRVVTSICGLSVHDLADQPFHDWFDDEMTPRDAAMLALEDEGFPFED